MLGPPEELPVPELELPEELPVPELEPLEPPAPLDPELAAPELLDPDVLEEKLPELDPLPVAAFVAAVVEEADEVSVLEPLLPTGSLQAAKATTMKHIAARPRVLYCMLHYLQMRI